MAVWEVVQMTIPADRHDEFESVLRANLSLFKDAKGCQDVTLQRVVDKEDMLVLQVVWETLAHHTEIFVNSAAFTRFTGLVRPFFAAPPVIYHATTVIDGLWTSDAGVADSGGSGSGEAAQ